jgi:hypothetical protein
MHDLHNCTVVYVLYRTTPAASASASIAPPAAAFLSRAQKYPGGGNKIIPHTGTSYSHQCGMVVRPLIVGSFVHKSSSSIPFPSNHTRTADLEAEAVNQFDALQLFLLCCCMRGKEKKREGERKNKKVSGCAFFFLALRSRDRIIFLLYACLLLHPYRTCTAAAACAMSGRRGWIGDRRLLQNTTLPTSSNFFPSM